MYCMFTFPCLDAIRNVILIILLSFVGMMASAQSSHSDTQMNVILIMADDIGVEAINHYGGEYFTPNIDELARNGVSFLNAHATPVCTPTRTRLMTARENAKNYKAFGYLDPKEITFAHGFKESGYVTGITGKWQLSGNGYDGRVGASPRSAGFDESFLWQVKSNESKGSRYWGPVISKNGRTINYETGFGPDYINDFALDFIDRHQNEKFFLYYPMVLPHSPFVGTPDAPNVTGDKARFSAMITYMDKMVGNVVSKLSSLNLENNTIIVFVGDNGTNTAIQSYRGTHKISGGKGSAILNGTHVPLVFYVPGVSSPGTTRDALFDIMDMYPTLAELSNVTIANGEIDGVSQAEVISGSKDSVRDWIFMHYAPGWIHDPARFVFNKEWKLYGNDLFVKLDPYSGLETKVDPNSDRSARKQYRAFSKIMANMGDGELDQTMYPMCIGKSPLVSGQKPEVVGCSEISGYIKGKKK